MPDHRSRSPSHKSSTFHRDLRESNRPRDYENSNRHRDYENSRKSLSTTMPNRHRDYENEKRTEPHEDSKGLSFLEDRRLKRQELRKDLRNTIWNCTPSPPRNEYETCEFEAEDVEGVGDKDKEVMSSSESELYVSRGRRKSRTRRTTKRMSRRKLSESDQSDDSSDDYSSSDSEEEYRRQKRKQARRKSSRKYRESDWSDDSSDDYSSSDSEEEYRRQKRKRARRKSSRRERKGRVSRKRRRDVSSDESSETSESSEDSDVSGYSEDKSRRKKIVSFRNKERERESGSEGFEKVDNEVGLKLGEVKKNENTSELFVFKDIKGALEDENVVVGPMPLSKPEGHISYGGALRPGEGDAIAQYVQQGKRIPRRGEVGLSADEISRYESAGYVMSGNRHSRMNAVRIRKENQVYSAEDKRALAMINYEEKAKREQKIMAHLQNLVQRNIKEYTGPSHDPFADGRPAEDAHD